MKPGAPTTPPQGHVVAGIGSRVDALWKLVEKSKLSWLIAAGLCSFSVNAGVFKEQFMPVALKVLKNLPTGFQEEADAMKESELRNCIVQSEHNLQVEIESMENNNKYQALKTAYKEASEPLRDAKKCQKAKISYCLARLGELGKL